MQFNEPNPLALSHLGHAARMGDEENVLRLLENGRRVDVGDNRGWNAIHEAAAGNHVNCLRLLLKKGRPYVNCRTMEGETPLLLACMHQNNPDVLKMLLNHGADVNLGNNEHITPLHQACKDGKLELAVVLIAAGARLDVLNYNDCTPLHLAISSNNSDLVKYLIREGANLKKRDECGRTPLFLSCEFGNWDIVEPILNKYDEVNTRANDGATALMLASQHGHLKIVQELLNRGANPNLSADDRSMAIQLAVHNGHLSVVQLLLKVTSKRAILKNYKGGRKSYSVTCLAIDGNYPEVLKVLLSSDLGTEVLQFPLREVIIGKRELIFEFCYDEARPISFLFSKQFQNPEDVVVYLDLLLRHNFPVDAQDEAEIPPLVALCFRSKFLPDDITQRCLDLLVSHSADLDYTRMEVDVPEALWAACVESNWSFLLKLLRAGCSGSPEGLLELILHKYFLMSHSATRNDMIKYVLKLGISKPSVAMMLVSLFSKFERGGCDMSAYIAEHQLCSLQQLSRLAVRKYLKKPFTKSLSELSVPTCIKEYITFHKL